MSKFKIRESYLLLLIVLGLVSLGIYTTYALFTASTTINDVVGITATLDIGKSLTEYEVITVQPNETKLIELNVVNSYNDNIYYGAWYQLIQGDSNNIQIGTYTEKNPNSSSGVLSSNTSIKLLVGITNDNTTGIVLYLGVKGSLTNDLNLGDNKILLPNNFSEGYSVTLNITNGTTNNNILKVKKGNDAIFTITPNTNYKLEIDSQTCNGTLNNTGTYTITNITEDKTCDITLKEKIIKIGSLADHIITTYTANNAVSTRTDFSNVFTETNDKIYTTNKTEDGSTVYYYAGNTTHNWVKFGKYTSDWYSCNYVYDSSTKYTMGTSCSYDYYATSYTPTKLASKNDDIYWKIIRTNEDGSIRLLYSGNAPDTTLGYIGFSKYGGSNSILFLGYMYGQSGSLSNNRLNTTNNEIKSSIDSWYKKHLYQSEYNSYVSKTAIYCNDRSIRSGTYSEDENDTTSFAPEARIIYGKGPSYKCGVDVNNNVYESIQPVADKFSVSTTNGGNGKLTYPIALMTVDELAFAGGLFYSNLSSPYAWYYSNSTGNSNTKTSWWTMSPRFSSGVNRVFVIESPGSGYNVYGKIADTNIYYPNAIRPVLSLKSCAKYSSGDGSSSNPYTVTVDEACATAEN